MSKAGDRKRAVVIGGAGFMGSHTADELSRQGLDVVVYDRLASPWLRDGQRMVVGDILDRDALNEVIRGASYVYHLAGIADIAEASRRAYDTINLNVMGTTAALDASAAAGVERFVYASTMYVYSPYGAFYRASKQAAETIVEVYQDKLGLDYTLLRYGSLYGPRAQDWNGLRHYVSQVVRDGRLVYSGTGKERREYIHVRDAARLSVEILDEQHRNQAITVTGQQILTSSELIEMIFEIAGTEVDIEYDTGSMSADHYTLTPYRYTPKQAKKLVPDEFIDIGQGILDIVAEIHEALRAEPESR